MVGYSPPGLGRVGIFQSWAGVLRCNKCGGSGSETLFRSYQIESMPLSPLFAYEDFRVKTTPIILFTGLFFVLASAAVPTSDAAGGSIDTVRKKFDAFNRHDAAAIQEIYASNATLHSPDYPSLEGNASIADTYRKLFDAIPDAKDNLELLETSANHVYAQFVLTGHWKGAEDKPLNVRIISVYAVKDGHIVEDSTYYDRNAP
jgi:ketosteroid isomerase-like protein